MANFGYRHSRAVLLLRIVAGWGVLVSRDYSWEARAFEIPLPSFIVTAVQISRDDPNLDRLSPLIPSAGIRQPKTRLPTSDVQIAGKPAWRPLFPNTLKSSFLCFRPLPSESVHAEAFAVPPLVFSNLICTGQSLGIEQLPHYSRQFGRK